MVIVLPVLLALVLIIIQACLWWFARQAVFLAAREGAETGRSYSVPARDAGASRTREIARDLGGHVLTDPAVTATRSARQVTVTVHGHARSLVPLVPGITVSARVVAPMERWTKPGQ